MEEDESGREHLLQKYGVLVEFDIVNITTLEEFMDTYEQVANSPDDINELQNVSGLLGDRNADIPGFVISDDLKNKERNPELDKIAYAVIEFLMKKTVDPHEWAYVLTYIIDKLGLEFDGDEEEDE